MSLRPGHVLGVPPEDAAGAADGRSGGLRPSATQVQPDTADPEVVRPEQPTTTPRPSTDEGDHDRFAHYVPKDKLTQALVEGTPVRALCGKVWVPSRDPDRYPVCPTCKELLASRGEAGDGGGGSDGDGGDEQPT